MGLNKEKLKKELSEDLPDIKKVLAETKVVKEVKRDKQHEIISTKKKIVDSKGREIPSFWGRTLKRTKKLHGHKYVAQAGTKFDDCPMDFLVKVTFDEALDFE